MALQMAAAVRRSLLFVLFLFIFVETSHADRITYSREELLLIGNQTPETISPNRIDPESLLELLIEGAAAVDKSKRRGNEPVRWCDSTNEDFVCPFQPGTWRTCGPNPIKQMNCFFLTRQTRTLLSLLSSASLKPGLMNVFLATERNIYQDSVCIVQIGRKLSGKTKGGGIVFYVNESWCTDVTVLSKLCSPNLESPFLNCKPFYSPREFSSFILAGVYIPPHADVNDALQALADQVISLEQIYPDSLLIIVGDL